MPTGTNLYAGLIPCSFIGNRLNRLSLPQPLIFRVLLFSQAEEHRLVHSDFCFISPFPKFENNKSLGKRALCPSHSSFGAVPFLFEWMFGKVTGIQIFFFLPLGNTLTELWHLFSCFVSTPPGKEFQQEEFRATYTTFLCSRVSWTIVLSSLCGMSNTQCSSCKRYRDHFRN